MRLKTRFFLSISFVILGFMTISSMAAYLAVKVNELNRADTICRETIDTLKDLQIKTTELLVTHELEHAYTKWQSVYQHFQNKLEALNKSPIIHSLLSTEEQKSILKSMNAFWVFTHQKTVQVDRDIAKLMNRENLSRDGLIYQYADSGEYQILVFRNNVLSAKYFLESEFEVRLATLISIVDRAKSDRTRTLSYQIVIIGLTVFIMISGALISFLLKLRAIFEKLHRSMEIIGRGDFTEKLDIPGNDELSEIADAINRTTDKLGDIHNELEQRIEELSQAKDEADRANRAKSVFLANMSHEIRTPLNAVTGFSELLSNLVTDEKQKSYLSAIKQAGRSLLTLINDVLDLSKIEAGKLDVQYSFVHIKTLLSEVEQIFAAQAVVKNIAFVNNINDKLPDVLRLDEIRLRQILFNLVGNAVKFTQEGHIKISADVINERNSAIDICISVEDTGIGIAENELESIFVAFGQQTGQDISKFGGTGLGLAISKRLVEMMNGRISVKSIPGRGTVFSIILNDVEYASEADVPSDDSGPEQSVVFQNCRVLIVDDVKSNRDFLKELLTGINLHVLTAENGQEAVLMSTEFQPSIILMDIRMPMMDGFEATRRIKEDPLTSQIPVVAVTASISMGNHSDVLKKAFDGYLFKPIATRELIAELKKNIPFTMRNVVSSPSQALSQDDASMPLSAEFQSRLPEVLNILQSVYLNRWNEIKDRLPIEETRMFGKGLRNLGMECGIAGLEAYGKDLVSHVDNFDIGKMQLFIAGFPEFIRKLGAEQG